jgi:hypothetical protein
MVDVLSPHPQNRPGIKHVVVTVVVFVAVVSSLHPQNRPGVMHVVVGVAVDSLVVVVVDVVAVESLQPNQPLIILVSVGSNKA